MCDSQRVCGGEKEGGDVRKEGKKKRRVIFKRGLLVKGERESARADFAKPPLTEGVMRSSRE